MFGTFQAEEEEPVYGLTKPLNSWNPLWANLHVWRDLCHDAWLAPIWIDKLRIWFMPQGWRPHGLPPNTTAPEVSRKTVINYHTRVPRELNGYALIHFVAALAVAIVLLATEGSLQPTRLVATAMLVLWALLGIGGIFDHRRWALPSELIRLPITAFALAAVLPEGPWLMPVRATLVLTVVGMWLFLVRYRSEFDGGPHSFPTPPMLDRVVGSPRA
jgi:hypothetical protein